MHRLSLTLKHKFECFLACKAGVFGGRASAGVGPRADDLRRVKRRDQGGGAELPLTLLPAPDILQIQNDDQTQNSALAR